MEKEVVKKNGYFSFVKNLSKKVKIIIGIIIILIITLFVAFGINRNPDVDTVFLKNVLTKSSELTTAKLKITGLSEYHDEGIYIFNRSDFTMCFTATIRAGINFENVKIDSDPIQKKIFIEIPNAEIFDAKVDPNDLRFYGTGFALFNVNEKEDLAKALSLAEEDAKKEASNTGILELANQQSETLIRGILSNTIPKGYTLEIKR
ncbi:MAG: DUF4230 domain-containing protein [Clostridia bacterium]|nr:DUF4230 domain-containing protein [Clostridia bacterium]